MNQPSAPLVSVVIPAYNARNFILDAIDSVLAQDYPALEILVIDDGSTDDTVALLEREAPAVTIIRQANAGAAAARNAGLRNARGEFICFLDADDGWFPGKLSSQVDYLTNHPEVGVVFHRWHVWKPGVDGSYTRPAPPDEPPRGEIDPEESGWLYPHLLLDCVVHTSTVMMRREVVARIGLFETGLVTGEDYDYWLRVSRHYPIHKLRGVYSFYRQTPGSLTSAPRERNNEYEVLQQALNRWGLSSPDGSHISRTLVKDRLAKLSFDFGYAHYHNGSAELATAAFLKCLRHDPLRWRALAYALASWVRMKNSDQ